MPVLEVGRVCVKTKGRNTGKKVVVVGIEKGFALVDGINFKKKRQFFSLVSDKAHDKHFKKLNTPGNRKAFKRGND